MAVSLTFSSRATFGILTLIIVGTRNIICKYY